MVVLRRGGHKWRDRNVVPSFKDGVIPLGEAIVADLIFDKSIDHF